MLFKDRPANSKKDFSVRNLRVPGVRSCPPMACWASAETKKSPIARAATINPYCWTCVTTVKPNDPRHPNEPKHTGTLNRLRPTRTKREFQINDNRKSPASETNTGSIANHGSIIIAVWRMTTFAKRTQSDLCQSSNERRKRSRMKIQINVQ